MTDSKPPQTPVPSRRSVLAAGLTAAVGFSAEAPAAPAPSDGKASSTLRFTEIAHGLDERHAVSPGHTVQVVLRWGDTVIDGAPQWNPEAQTPAAQTKQFGYDNDFIAFKPLPYGSGSSKRGLLCVNHESARSQMMFPGFTKMDLPRMTREQIDVEIAALGFSIVEISETGGQWSIDTKSKYNRRITADTEIDIAGPAAGHARMRTTTDPAGRLARGTFGNCAGGETPWGTVLTAEENVHYFFAGDPKKTSEAKNHQLMGVGEPLYAWGDHYARFNVEKEPTELNRFGWIVEIDPYEPGKRPAKRTAMGRCKHEGAGVVVNGDGRIVCYMGDDEYFQFVTKFVSRGKVDTTDRARNWGLLDDGTLYAGRFNDNGTIDWLPLVWGVGPLTSANGFASQGDVLIDARRAAAAVGATPMDRPEDIEWHKPTNSVFMSLTKNSRRSAEATDGANPRARNRWGQVMQIFGADGDHAALTARWEMLFLGGDPNDPATGAKFHPGVTAAGWLVNPDNFAVDPQGRLWIGTDGANDFGFGDGLWATDVVGAGRALTRHFFRCPIGGELTGPTFTPDGTTLFCSVQHPGDANGGSYVKPATRWPDFKDGVPPRPSVIAIRTVDGKPIG